MEEQQTEQELDAHAMEHAMDANNVPPLLASGRAWSNPYLSNDDQAELEAMLERRDAPTENRPSCVPCVPCLAEMDLRRTHSP